MSEPLLGMKLRALRSGHGLTQTELARRAGISPSYLNLIECNKRPAGSGLVARIARALDVDEAALDSSSEKRLAETLDEIAAEPAIAARPASKLDSARLVGSHPDWAELIVRLYQAFNDERQAVLALADRLNRDPFLSEGVHKMVTNVTSVRAAAEILDAGTVLSDEARARFLSIIASDTRKLSDTVQSLVSFFDNAHLRVRSETPMEHVDRFITETDNHFPGLEELAARLMRDRRPGETAHDFARRAAADRREAAASSSGSFASVRAAIEPRALEIVEEIVACHDALASEESRQLATSALLNYAVAALLMPYDEFLEAADACRYDLDLLSGRFGVSYEQAAHRLASLRRRGAEGVRFAFMRSDPSGHVTKRLPLARLSLPRYGTACPLWVVYHAFQTPGATVRAFGRLYDGNDFLFFARAVEKAPSRIGLPRHLLSVMLACSADDAARVVYSDGIDRSTATVPVGTVCRLCPRSACGHRQEEPLIA